LLIMKKLIKGIAYLLLLVLIVVGGYVGYAFAFYHRIPDNQALEPTCKNDNPLPYEETLSIVTWNLGFGAYSADYSFFMDGGTESRAFSEGAVWANINTAVATLKALDPDLIALQEVDIGSTRSYQVDQSAVITKAFDSKDSVFAQNYDSVYLMYPFNQPHGKSRSGLLTLTDSHIDSSLRRQLPVEGGFRKFLDLDRCYSISRIPVSNGKTLSLFNLHLSAYTADGKITAQQLNMISEDIQKEYDDGAYVIVTGDFNRDLYGNADEIFGFDFSDLTWAQPVDAASLPKCVSIVSSLDEAAPIASCRLADAPYEPGVSTVLTIDGFIGSDNIEVVSCRVVDEGFAVSDHNPVEMVFRFR
ncbi:MAG: endonuclease/exonuclease/phosphatase family protein, partial [Clostridia bacterium]|nr:endonuclease/exonuclease/phosphatase family protein [Clostridia bacterium]